MPLSPIPESPLASSIYFQSTPTSSEQNFLNSLYSPSQTTNLYDCDTQLLIPLLKKTHPADRLELLAKLDNSGNTTLHRLLQEMYDPELLQGIVDLLSLEDVQMAMGLENIYGKNVIEEAQIYLYKLMVFLRRLPKQQFLQFITQDSPGNLVMHLCKSYSFYLEAILQVYPEKALYLLLQERCSLLHAIENREEHLRIALQTLEPKQVFYICKLQDANGFTILHRTAQYPESFAVILAALNKLCPANRSAVTRIQSVTGNTVFHAAAPYPPSLTALLDFVATYELLVTRNTAGNTPLHLVAKQPDSLQTLFEALPKESVQFVLNDMFNTAGQSVRALATKESLQRIRHLMPIDYGFYFRCLLATSAECALSVVLKLNYPELDTLDLCKVVATSTLILTLFGFFDSKPSSPPANVPAVQQAAL